MLTVAIPVDIAIAGAQEAIPGECWTTTILRSTPPVTAVGNKAEWSTEATEAARQACPAAAISCSGIRGCPMCGAGCFH